MKKVFQDNEHATSNSAQIAVLKEHFPSCFDKDGAFLPDKLQAIVEEAGAGVSREGYSLEWLGRSYARLLANQGVQTLLKADKDHNALPENAQSKNLLIKGDNLEVLKHLLGAYREQVKMIYIDPPYNTGSDGFVYADDRKFTVEELSRMAGMDEEQARRVLDFTNSNSNSHSAWLTFMYPRLYVARRLLRDDGVIFVSIDDNEQAQLKLLMDEVFGEENFIAELIWDKQHSQQQGIFKRYHEYVLVFARDIAELGRIAGGEGVIEAGALKKVSKANPASDFVIPAGTRFEAPDGTAFTGTYGDSEKVTVVRGVLSAQNGRTSQEVTLNAGWTQKNQMVSWFAGNETHDSKGQKVLEFYFSSTGKLKSRKERGVITPPSILPRYGMVSEQTAQLDSLMGGHYFDTPKPVELIKDQVRWFTSDNSTVLDFFAGSGTTADAVMQLNAEDGGNRQFVCVQLDEKTDPKSEAYKAGYHSIFDITRERIKRAAAKIKADKPDYAGDLGFKLFETTPVFDGYLDDVPELNETAQIFDGSHLGQEERQSLLLTWAAQDGMPLTESLQPVILHGLDANDKPTTNYTAYMGASKSGALLYLMDNDLNIDHIVALLCKIEEDDNFAPSRIVAFESIFTNNSKAKRELKESIQHFDKHNRKSLPLELEFRF